LPAGQNAVTDLQGVLDNIIDPINNTSYPSLGPYIGKNLIQHLVTSNPSPDYVTNVTNAFNSGIFDNGSGYVFGSGQRGDLKATIAAILLDPEARNPNPDSNFGHLKEPVLWITDLMRAFNTNTTTVNTDFVLGERFLLNVVGIRMDQDVFYSPTVFNFFPPDYAIPGEDNLLGPEFAIQSTATSLARTNFGYQVIYPGIPANGDHGDRPLGTRLDLSGLEDLAGDPTALVDFLNTLMLDGTMTPEMRDLVINDVSNIPDNPGRVKDAVYLIATSSQYLVER
jgi:hypothetical protein